MRRLSIALAVVTLTTILVGTAPGQGVNQILTVTPSTATQGTSGLTVVFTLDTGGPPYAPEDFVPVTNATLGTSVATSKVHTSQYVVTAVFDIPADEPLGARDVAVMFPSPGGDITFSKSGGFTVTGDGGTEQPHDGDDMSGSNLFYAVVDTGQDTCSDNSFAISSPGPGDSFAGQDAQYDGYAPRFVLSDDGLTVYDSNTGLTWQQDPDIDDDGDIDADDKLSWADLQFYPGALNGGTFGGYNDWRLPSIKELYSLIDFRGTDPNVDGTDTAGLVPFIDTNYFAFAYGDTNAGERIIDSQYASSNLYVADSETLFGVNFADGRIKGYGLTIMGGDKTFFVCCCRGNTDYGKNRFVDNGDGTIADHATGLTWQQYDSGSGMDWEAALLYAENLELAGRRDWRLPNAKELQSILDYTRSPDTTSSAAIDPLFTCSVITNMNDDPDYPFYWSSTTHLKSSGSAGHACYVAFGRGLGTLDEGATIIDIHGAGCQRSDPKTGDPGDYPNAGNGPQGDVSRVFNHVRCVRGGATDPQTDTDDDGLTDWYEYNYSTNITNMVATADGDEDGSPNIDEAGAGTIPTDGDSVLAITDVSVSASSVVVTWMSELGETYTLKQSTNLLSDDFTLTIATGINGTGSSNSYTNSPESPGGAYRVFAD